MDYRNLVKLQIILNILFAVQGKAVDYQLLFRRIPDAYLKVIPQKVAENTTLDICAALCAREVEFECKSFDIDNKNKECHLHNHTHTEPLIGLQHAIGFDHYRTAYERLFNRIPNHVITLRHNRNIVGLTVEECSRRCILEMTFKCRGFDYEIIKSSCWLTNKLAHDVQGLKQRRGIDYYERKSQGALGRFINYGYGSLQTLEGVQIHGKIVLGVNLDACAQLCLAETSFICASFDYVFGEQSCQLSQYIAANVHGIRTDFDNGYQVMHFEQIGEYLDYFYPTPYASLLGNNDRILKKISPETCARKCLEEREFICRSFDYQIEKGTCLLSHVTGSDIGGLYTPDLVQVHHFEMKPSLDCGSILEGERGTLTSPNWPRHYSHHLNCTWSIRVKKFKIIRLDICHLDLGSQTEDYCSLENDVLYITEMANDTIYTQCLRNIQTEIVSQSNSLNVTFVTNVGNDAQGFRIFYSSDWPCNVTFYQENGEFASPRWPNSYPSSTVCIWKISGPRNSKITLRFNYVELEDHTGSSCVTAFDKIDIYDKAFSSSKPLRTLCGHVDPYTLTSQGNVVKIHFISDARVQVQGFHASYKIVQLDKPVLENRLRTIDSFTTKSYAIIMTQTYTSWNNITNNESLANEPKAVNTVNGIDTTDDNTMSEESVTLSSNFMEMPKQDDLLQTSNISIEIHGITGDDTEMGLPPQIKFDHHLLEKPILTILLGVIVAFLLLLICLTITACVICRRYRKRMPKHRQCSNVNYPDERVSLCNSNCNTSSNQREYKDEEDIDDAARLPSPCDHEPIPAIEFQNPLFHDLCDRTVLTNDTSIEFPATEETDDEIDNDILVDDTVDDTKHISDDELNCVFPMSSSVNESNIVTIDCYTTV